MAADPVIYCLEQLTDYDQFERLCHDMMALAGYRGIEPLGGTKDKGRDALHRDPSTGTPTVFAYSVREDWRAKLAEDASKVHAYGHACQRLAFLCTSHFTASERDEAVDFVKMKYGWALDLFGLERLAVMLRTTHKDVVARHPQLFCPPFFPIAGGLSLSPALDHVLVDHLDADAGLAHWLSRRLTLAGYNVWCRGLAPLAGSSVAETIRELLKSRAFRYICILSPGSATHPDFIARRGIAHSIGSQRGGSLLLPALAQQIDTAPLEEETRRLEFARFDQSWGTGLKHVEQVLASANCPRTVKGARELAIQSYFPSEIVLAHQETIYSNLFRVRQLPEAILRFGSKKPIHKDDGSLAATWAFRRTSDTELLSFQHPPEDVRSEFGLFDQGGALWSKSSTLDGINTDDLLKELIKKTLYVEFRRRGLQYCEERKLVYFPAGLLRNDHLRLTQPDGTPSFFAVAGERSYGKAERGNKYRYQIAPVFVPRGDSQSGFEIILRIRVRITDLAGKLYPGPATNARRKKLCKSWWNQEWFNRLLGVMQFLAGDGEVISIGAVAGASVVVERTPRTWLSPVRLNEEALLESGSSPEEEELHASHDDEDEDEEDEEAPASP